MIISKVNLALLNATFSGVYQTAFEQSKAWSDALVTKVPVGAVKGIYGWAAFSAGVREWVGDRISVAMQAHVYELPHRKFEMTFKVPRDHILRDNLGIFSSVVIPMMADAVKKHADQLLIASVFTANPLGFDGVSFFNAAHPTYNGATNYTNVFTVDASTLESLSNELARVRASMATIKGQNGIVLASNHTLLLTPMAQEMRLRKVVQSSTIPADSNGSNVDNPLNGVFTVLAIPELDLIDPNVIYSLDVSRPIKPFLLQIGSNPVFRSFTADPDNLHAFTHDEYIYGIDGDNGGAYEINAGVTLPFLAAKITLDNLPT